MPGIFREIACGYSDTVYSRDLRLYKYFINKISLLKILVQTSFITSTFVSKNLIENS